MPEYISVPLVAIVVLAVFVGMGFSWWRMNRRDSGLQPLSVPDDLGQPGLSADTLYVATTAAESPLARLTIPGLGFRGRAQLSFYEEGIVLDVAGGAAVFIPDSALRGAGTATVAIDRVVEKNGMVRFTWIVPGTGTNAAGNTVPTSQAVDSYLRVVDPVASQAVLRELQRRAPEQEAGSTGSAVPDDSTWSREHLSGDSSYPDSLRFTATDHYPRRTAAESEV